MASASSERPQSADVTSSDGGVAPPSDGELVAAVLAGRRQAFDELARRYSGALWRLAKSRLGSREAADDAVQETLLAAFRWLKGYDSRFSFRTWLWSILLNECRRSLAKRAKRRELTSGGDAAAQEQIAELTVDDNPARQAMASERAELVERLLERLPESQADALRLRFFGDLKFQEIADVTECSLSTAKVRVRDGLLRLAAWLGDDEGNDEGARDGARDGGESNDKRAIGLS